MLQKATLKMLCWLMALGVGAVACSGDEATGSSPVTDAKFELSDGAALFDTSSPEPSILVADDANQSGAAPEVQDISYGVLHRCILFDDGAINCAVLGSTNIYRLSLPPEGPYMAISLGYSHGCGLRRNGALECWGEHAEMHNSSSGPRSRSYLAIEAKSNSTCGLDLLGRILCWDKTDPDSAAEIEMPENLGPFVALYGGVTGHCGLDAGGTTVCWGSDAVASDVPNVKLKAIAIGIGQACGLQSSGATICWGDVRRGVEPPQDSFDAIVASGNTYCGHREDGSLLCWGHRVPNGQETRAGEFSVVAGSRGYHSDFCGIRRDGQMSCWSYR